MQCMQPEHAAAFTAQVTGLAQHGFDLVVEVLLRAAAAAVLPVREDAFGLVGECPGKSLDKGGDREEPPAVLAQAARHFRHNGWWLQADGHRAQLPRAFAHAQPLAGGAVRTHQPFLLHGHMKRLPPPCSLVLRYSSPSRTPKAWTRLSPLTPTPPVKALPAPQWR